MLSIGECWWQLNRTVKANTSSTLIKCIGIICIKCSFSTVKLLVIQIQSFWKYYSSAHKHMQQITKVTLIQSAAIQNRFFLFAKHPLTFKYLWAADEFKLTYGVYIKITGSYIQITVIYDSYVTDCNCNLLPPLLSRRQPPVSKLLTGRSRGFWPCKGDGLHWWSWNLALRTRQISLSLMEWWGHGPL